MLIKKLIGCKYTCNRSASQNLFLKVNLAGNFENHRGEKDKSCSKGSVNPAAIKINKEWKKQSHYNQ
jgi:hypothetical protein